MKSGASIKPQLGDQDELRIQEHRTVERPAARRDAHQRKRGNRSTEERAFEDHPVLSLVAQMVKNLPPMLETWVQSLGWEDTLENGMATHSSNLACRIPQTEEPGGL